MTPKMRECLERAVRESELHSDFSKSSMDSLLQASFAKKGLEGFSPETIGLALELATEEPKHEWLPETRSVCGKEHEYEVCQRCWAVRSADGTGRQYEKEGCPPADSPKENNKLAELESAARAYIKAHRGMVVRLQEATAAEEYVAAAKRLEGLVPDDESPKETDAPPD